MTGLCECGCGARTNVAKRSSARERITKGEYRRFVPGHNRRPVGTPARNYVEEDRGHDTPCWIWQLYVGSGGYGRVGRDGQTLLAHIAFWTDRYGPVPEGLELDHLCGQSACVNPDHLEAVTHLENVHRSAATKLTQDEVAKIRASADRNADLAVVYGVDPSTISVIRSGRSRVAS